MLTNQWTEINSPMNQKRWGHQCVKSSEDKILVIGGYDGNGWLKSTEVYDRRNHWTYGPTLPNQLKVAQFFG